MILAIDQGSSKTEACLVGLDGAILGIGRAGGACYFSVGMEAALREIQQAAQQALKVAGAGMSDVTRLSGGIAGANWPEEVEMLTRTLSEQFGVADVVVYNDCVPALYGGTSVPNAIVLCAGSGFNGAVKVNGEIRLVLNNYVDTRDQGSLGLCQRALEAVFESHVGIRPETLLTHELLVFFDLPDVDRLLLARDRRTLSKPTHLAAPSVLRAARANDPVALDVILAFSRSIARYACGALRRFDLIGKQCDVVLSGGLFKADNPLFREIIAAEVHRTSQQARVLEARFEPVLGAALMGLDACKAGADARKVCRDQARQCGLIRKRGE